MKSFMPTESVRMSAVEVNDRANRNSCQVTISTKTAVATMPGRHSGSTISTKARSGRAPSMAADSSSVTGILPTKPRSSQIETGRVTVM